MFDFPLHNKLIKPNCHLKFFNFHFLEFPLHNNYNMTVFLNEIKSISSFLITNWLKNHIHQIFFFHVMSRIKIVDLMTKEKVFFDDYIKSKVIITLKNMNE